MDGLRHGLALSLSPMQAVEAIDTRARTSMRSIWMLALPLILSTATETILHLSGVVFLARGSAIELGAVAVGFAIFDLAVVLLLALADSIQVVTSRRAGEEAPDEIGRAFNQGLWLTLMASVLLVAALEAAGPLLVRWTAHSAGVQQAAEAFVAIVTLSLPLHATNLVLYGFFVGILRTRVLFWYTALVATSNVLFNYCLILGHCGFARLGIRGAALSDLLAESAGCLFLMLYAHLCGAARQFGLFRFTRWRHPLNSVFRNLAAPSALKGLIECAAWMVFFGIFERRGPEALASASVVYAVYIFLLIPSKGFSEVICATVSNLIGQGEEAKIRVAIGRTITLNFVNTGPFLIFAAVCPALAISVIGSEGAAIGDCSASLRILAIAMCAAIPAQIYANAVYGTGDSFSTLGIEALASVSLVAAAYCAAIVLKFPPAYTWCALGISWLVSLGLSSLWLQHGAWRRVKI